MVCNFTGLLKAPKSESNVAIRDCFALDHAFEMKFAFPCCVCTHRHGSDRDEPCRRCTHNMNAGPA